MRGEGEHVEDLEGPAVRRPRLDVARDVGDRGVEQPALDLRGDRGDEPGPDHGTVGLDEPASDGSHGGRGQGGVGEGRS